MIVFSNLYNSANMVKFKYNSQSYRKSEEKICHSKWFFYICTPNPVWRGE